MKAHSSANSTSSASAVVKPEYERAPFKAYVSKISNSKVTLVKVPKGVSESWRNAANNSTVAVLSKTKKGFELIVGGPAVATAPPAGTRLVGRDVEMNPSVYILSSGDENKRYSDVAATVGKNIQFTAPTTGSYRKILRQRHLERDLQKVRGTKEEKRPEAAFDDRTTLFQYYQPEDTKEEHAVDEITLSSTMGPSSSRSKAKAKKQATLTEDELKIRLFSMFEEAGEEGLMLKQIVTATGQPQSFVKGVVDEIAEPGRRRSDKRLVLFVKDHFNPFSAGVAEEPDFKKPRLR